MNGNDQDEEAVVAGAEEVPYETPIHNNDMTQDVIEWDESTNVDLRCIVPSPHPSESKATTPRTGSSKTSTNSSLFFGNDDTTNPTDNNRQQQVSKRNLDGSFQQVSDSHGRDDRSRASKRRSFGPDREIDGILGIIDKESHRLEDGNDPMNDGSVPLAELQTQPRTNKRRATTEILRHRSQPHQQAHKSTSSKSSFSIRNRRRRIELMEQRQQQKQQQQQCQRPHKPVNPLRRSRSLPDKTRPSHGKELLAKTPVRQNSTPSHGTACGNNDGFSELLEALTTPNTVRKKQPSRPPLGFVDKNVSHPQRTKNLDNTTTSAESSNENISTTCAVAVTTTLDIIHSRHSQSSRVSISPTTGRATDGQLGAQQLASNSNNHPGIPHHALDASNIGSGAFSHGEAEQVSRTGEQGDENEDDEFDDVSLSENDLALIDSVAEASLANQCKKEEPADARIVLSSLKNIHIQADDTNDQSDDEFDDFPVEDFDFSKIDAMVVTKSRGDSQDFARYSEDQACKLPKEEDDDDDFGDFPTDLDFGKIDALVASQTIDPSIAEYPPNGFNNHDMTTSSTKATVGHDSEDDEFDDFPADIDFSDIDAMVERKRNNEESLPNSQGTTNTVIHAKHEESVSSERVPFLRFSRYRVVGVVDDDTKHYTKTVSVVSLDDLDGIEESSHTTPFTTLSSSDGHVRLCGEWYDTPLGPGDIVHISSLTGRSTDKSALPLTLESMPGGQGNDLLLVLNPDKLMSPSIISEASFCNRRAVLKAKLGSTGLTSTSALMGTMLHGLFQKCLTSKRFDTEFSLVTIENIVRENAESLIGCNALEQDVKKELLDAAPTIQAFAARFTTMVNDNGGDFVGGVGMNPDIFLKGQRAHSVEEGIESTELGLKGNIDAVLEADIVPAGKGDLDTNYASPSSVLEKLLICLELKTGHKQSASTAHCAQLALYIMMLQSRFVGGESLHVHFNICPIR